MAGKPVIAVVGATGAQGGGLVRAILNDSSANYAVRAITRDVNSDKAKSLARLGADVVAASLDDEASLFKAFKGADAAYCVTFYWNHFSPERETANARAMARAAREHRVSHVIWSTLEDTRKFVPLTDNRMPTLMGHYKVPHFDSKGEANATFIELGVPTTIMNTSFYWENFVLFGLGPKRGPDGTLAITLPIGSSKLPGIAVDDIGRCAYGIFKKGSELIGKEVGIAGEHLTGAEMAAGFAKALGQPVKFNDIPPEVYRGFGFPGAEDMGNMFQFNRDFSKEFCAARDIGFSRSVNPALESFDAWLKENAKRVPLE